MNTRRESKFYQTDKFKRLEAIWKAKLKRCGFQDIENANGTVKNKNIRTQAYRQQEDLVRISSALGSYIYRQDIKLKRKEKKVLDLFSQGFYRKEIMKQTGLSHTTVWQIRQKHLPLALGFYAQEVDTLQEGVETNLEDERRFTTPPSLLAHSRSPIERIKLYLRDLAE